MKGLRIGSIILAWLIFAPIANASNANKAQHYAGQLLTPLEFSAAIVLWNGESNWNVSAHNGSHWGICQGRSQYMKRANYKQQVQWCIKYDYNRYGSIALALEHWRTFGWH